MSETTSVRRRSRRLARKPSLAFGASHLVFLCLALFTLSAGDGNVIAEWIVGAVLLLLAAWVLFLRPLEMGTNWPLVILLCMAGYGIVQLLLSSHVVVYDNLTAIVFWLTAAAICFCVPVLFQTRQDGRHFRTWLAWFATAVCVQDLLQQGTRTDRYFWFFPSKFHSVSGPFAYWNNFAQFIELALPVTLWLGIGGTRLRLSYLVFAALQIGSVAAAGSRAGAVLVLLELVTILFLVFLRNRNRNFLGAAATTLLVSGFCIYIAGTTHVMEKFSQPDQLAVRARINASSLAMIRQRPFSGWGLGSYVSAYRQFATYDDGTYVNRAHNDWLQWSAEGGIPFAALMAVLLIWSSKGAIRSVWGIGVLAVCLHATVDYPFARFGVCGWYFALLGLLQAETRRQAIAPAASNGPPGAQEAKHDDHSAMAVPSVQA